MKRLRL